MVMTTVIDYLQEETTELVISSPQLSDKCFQQSPAHVKVFIKNQCYYFVNKGEILRQ